MYFAKYLILFLKATTRIFKRVLLYIHHKKRLAIPFYGFMLFVLYIMFLIQISGDPNFSNTLQNKRINDVTQINPIHVNKLIRPSTIDDISLAIKSSTGPISIGGGKFSMGGQTAFDNSLHIDMRSFNEVIDLDTVKKQVTVQPGIIWRDLQEVIDPYNLSIKIMQTYANFTVGGSISVNCHGRYVGHGPIISSVLALKIVLATGEVLSATPNENQEVFYAAVGGYGGIGVIVEATLQLVDNVKVERHIEKIDITEYNNFFSNNIKNNKDVVFQNGDLYPPNYDKIINVSWLETSEPLTDMDRITPRDETYKLEHTLVEVVSWGKFGKWVRRNIIDPYIYSSEEVVWRNNEASYDVQELEPKSREEATYVLQEYFIPVQNIESFVPKMAAIYQKYNVNVINVSLRHALPDTTSYLSWAQEEVFAFVIYYKQKTTDKAKEEVRQWTVEMTDAIISEKGTWYLPYQPHASITQFNAGYPNANAYFDIKNKLDSTHRFTNKLLDKYNPYLQNSIAHERENIRGYFRAEEQTVLTVPEWYLVFNPKEYADFLEEGENPSDFPFYKSIDEYWKLYDYSLKLASEAYPDNSEYKTMLQVIGVSVTMEYGVKMLYENSIGKLFSLFAEPNSSNKEKTIAAAQRAYSDFIYHTAWYEFEFSHWIGEVWSEKEPTKSSFIRRWERTLFFTMEFSFKAMYAQLIEWAAKASYEAPVEDIYALVSNSSLIQETENLKIVLEQADKKIIAITRWGAFTETMLAISKTDIRLLDISGNDEITVSIIRKTSEAFKPMHADLLYNSAIVTNGELVRDVYLVPVPELLPFIRNVHGHNMIVEHIYDY